MSIGDITIFDQPSSQGGIGAHLFNVAAGAASTIINPGEPVAKALGNSTGNVVTQMATNKPVVATDFLAGIAMTTSTQTATTAGTVWVYPLIPGTTYLISPKVAASWDTQAEYDALVGARVLIDLTSGVYTLLATDGATSGCVVEALDVFKYPGKVAFSFRTGVSYFN